MSDPDCAAKVTETMMGMPAAAFVPWCFSSVILLYVMMLGFVTKELSKGQRQLLSFILPLMCAGFLAGLVGYIQVGGKIFGIGTEAVGGAAAFLVVFLSVNSWRAP